MVDLFVSCLLVAAGLCLTLIMFKLYTYLQCWSIYLYQQRSVNLNNSERLANTQQLQPLMLKASGLFFEGRLRKKR